MGIQTVAIVAPGDEDARHVTFADEVERVSSYLNGPEIIEAAQRSGAGMIHPGYGFLSERPVFARAVEKEGLIFIGPKAETMEKLGDKISAKELAAREQVPTLPWARIAPGEDLAREAVKIGFPLLIKAAAGGGGKGMRVVSKKEELALLAESASREALQAFGDGVLFLEKLAHRPRHIEAQIFGDSNGEAIHLYERECSLQRRHQKIWEEAQAPRIPEKTRSALLESALRLARSVKYRGAGTVEFLLDDDGSFSFLEMNTRLQVEHTVTEAITGVDLVRAQIELALAGECPKDPPSAKGAAIEVRINAEDPANGFVPSPGEVLCLRWPQGLGIRVESGIEQGQVVGTQFDPMLAKVIVHAATRDQALARMRYALEEIVILGVGTNIAFLRNLCDLPEVIKGTLYTKFIYETMSSWALEDSEACIPALEALFTRGPKARAIAERDDRSAWLSIGSPI